MIKKHTVAEYEIACCEAQEVYPLNREKREQYVKTKLRDNASFLRIWKEQRM